jgi:hypothetical protein
MRVKTSPVITSRLVLILATLLVLSAEIGGSPKRAGANPDLAALENSSVHLEARIESLIQSWFAVLEDPTAEAKTLYNLLAEAPFELLLDGEALHDRGALLAWVSSLRASYPQIEYRLDPIRIHSEGPDRYRVRFEFDRHALDDAGLPHAARREHIWIVQSSTSETPVILRIEERPLIFFPGTGPQVVCY